MADISKIEDLTGAIYDIKDASAREQIEALLEGSVNTLAPLKGTKAATSADNTAVAVGDGADATSNTIVIGQNAKASIRTGIIIGNNASSGASDSIGIGHNIYAGRSSSIVIGDKASVGESSEVVIGVSAAATGLNSTAIGSNASAKAANSVAVGGGSSTSEEKTFSVGSPAATRRVINVTDPTNDQDAATKRYVDSNIPTVDSSYDATSANPQSGTAVAEALNGADISKKINSIRPLKVDNTPRNTFSESSVVFGNGAYCGQQESVVIGANASSTDCSHNVVVGSDAKSENTCGVAVGHGASIAKAADDSVAIGYGAKATEEETVSFGRAEYSNYPKTRRLVQVTDPVNTQDAATKNYVDTVVSTKADQTDLDLTNKNIATLATGLSQKANKTDVETIQTKLDTIEEGANKTITDQTYSGASTNPQSGTAVKEALKTIVSGLAFSLTEAGLVHVELMEA